MRDTLTDTELKEIEGTENKKKKSKWMTEG